MQSATQNKNSRDYDGRLAAEAGQGFLGLEHARDIKRDHNQQRDQIGANPFSDEQDNRDKQNQQVENLW